VTDRKAQGIDATNQAFIRLRFRSTKKQEYHLAEGRHQEAFDEENANPEPADIGRYLRGGEGPTGTPSPASSAKPCHQIGFAILEGHGVDASLYQEAEGAPPPASSPRFGLEEKLRFPRPPAWFRSTRGYFPIKETSGIHPDLVEGWVFCRRALRPSTAIPRIAGNSTGHGRSLETSLFAASASSMKR